MPNRENQPARPRALIIPRPPWQPPQGAAELATALRQDLAEMIGALGLRVERNTQAAPQGLAGLLESSSEEVVVVFDDVPAMPPLAVEGALDELEAHDAVIGPCADGSLYIAAFAPGLDASTAADLARALYGPAEKSLAAVAEVLGAEGLATAVLPPWFRVGAESGLSFAQQLARLSLLSEAGEEDFLADRLRHWFETYAQA